MQKPLRPDEVVISVIPKTKLRERDLDTQELGWQTRDALLIYIYKPPQLSSNTLVSHNINIAMLKIVLLEQRLQPCTPILNIVLLYPHQQCLELSKTRIRALWQRLDYGSV